MLNAFSFSYKVCDADTTNTSGNEEPVVVTFTEDAVEGEQVVYVHTLDYKVIKEKLIT